MRRSSNIKQPQYLEVFRRLYDSFLGMKCRSRMHLRQVQSCSNRCVISRTACCAAACLMITLMAGCTSFVWCFPGAYQLFRLIQELKIHGLEGRCVCVSVCVWHLFLSALLGLGMLVTQVQVRWLKYITISTSHYLWKLVSTCFSRSQCVCFQKFAWQN